VGPGGTLDLPRGKPYRWWNDGEEELVFEGYARPVVDLDRVLQAFFEIANAVLRAGRRSTTSRTPCIATATRRWY
jgi:hypothetical protein